MNVYYCPHCDVSCMSASFSVDEMRQRHKCAPPPPPDDFFSSDIEPVG